MATHLGLGRGLQVMKGDIPRSSVGNWRKDTLVDVVMSLAIATKAIPGMQEHLEGAHRIALASPANGGGIEAAMRQLKEAVLHPNSSEIRICWTLLSQPQARAVNLPCSPAKMVTVALRMGTLMFRMNRPQRKDLSAVAFGKAGCVRILLPVIELTSNFVQRRLANLHVIQPAMTGTISQRKSWLDLLRNVRETLAGAGPPPSPSRPQPHLPDAYHRRTRSYTSSGSSQR